MKDSLRRTKALEDVSLISQERSSDRRAVRKLQMDFKSRSLSHPVPWYVLPSEKTVTMSHSTDTDWVHQNILLNIF